MLQDKRGFDFKSVQGGMLNMTVAVTESGANLPASAEGGLAVRWPYDEVKSTLDRLIHAYAQGQGDAGELLGDLLDPLIRRVARNVAKVGGKQERQEFVEESLGILWAARQSVHAAHLQLFHREGTVGNLDVARAAERVDLAASREENASTFDGPKQSGGEPRHGADKRRGMAAVFQSVFQRRRPSAHGRLGRMLPAWTFCA